MATVLQPQATVTRVIEGADVGDQHKADIGVTLAADGITIKIRGGRKAVQISYAQLIESGIALDGAGKTTEAPKGNRRHLTGTAS